MKEISPIELKSWMDSGEDFQLVDVREPHEYETVNLKGDLIPMNEIPSRTDEISQDKKVVVMCRSGMRSGNIVNYLEAAHGFENLYNLTGGILAYANQVDPSLPKYYPPLPVSQRESQ